jgi:hypothetical protein
MPMIISEPPVRDSLWTKSLRQDEDVMIRQWNPAYVNKEFCFFCLFRIYDQCIHSVRGQCLSKIEVREWACHVAHGFDSASYVKTNIPPLGEQ